MNDREINQRIEQALLKSFEQRIGELFKVYCNSHEPSSDAAFERYARGVEMATNALSDCLSLGLGRSGRD